MRWRDASCCTFPYTFTHSSPKLFLPQQESCSHPPTQSLPSLFVTNHASFHPSLLNFRIPSAPHWPPKITSTMFPQFSLLLYVTCGQVFFCFFFNTKKKNLKQTRAKHTLLRESKNCCTHNLNTIFWQRRAVVLWAVIIIQTSWFSLVNEKETA